MIKTIAKIGLPFVFIGVAALGFMLLVKTKPKPAEAATEGRVEAVDILVVKGVDTRAVLEGYGNVTPTEQLGVVPEVGGAVRFMHPNLVQGGFVKEGEVLVRLDQRDYRLAVQQQMAQVERSRFEIKLEQGRKTVAEREWTLLEKEIPVTEAGRELALREPNARIAKSNLSAASAGLKRARNALDRTTIKAPFDAMIVTENIEVGQVVGPGAPVITLMGVKRGWVEVSVPTDKLSVLTIPGSRGVAADAAGSEASITDNAGAARKGKVLRLLGSLDPRTRMARVIVEFSDPLGAASEKPVDPLLFGTYVKVKIRGASLGRVHEVPLDAVTTTSVVWIHDGGALKSKKVEIAWRDDKMAFVRGLADGDQVITSRLDAAVSGMPVTPRSDQAPAAKEGAAQ
jgi:RND family efflux transporter MFP subunit